ncbi:MAG: thioredoxin family protein [Planctomycetaceae bacterium]|nr:thioredoxin family protein [Planctomycetaceae bacterium]
MYALLYTRQGFFSFCVSTVTIVLLIVFYFSQGLLTAKSSSEPLKLQDIAASWRVESVGKAAQSAEQISFLNDYAAAVEESKAQKKPLLLYFFIFDKDAVQTVKVAPLPAFSNEEVKMLSGQFVCAALEVYGNAALCKTLGVNKYPSVVLFDAAGVEIQRLSGRQVEQGLAVGMHAAIQASVARVSTTLR